jgi:hypothetical protein
MSLSSNFILENVISGLYKKYKKPKNLKHPDPDISLKMMGEKNIALNRSSLIFENVISIIEKKYKKFKNLKPLHPDVSLKIIAEKNTALTDLTALCRRDQDDLPPFYIIDTF